MYICELKTLLPSMMTHRNFFMDFLINMNTVIPIWILDVAYEEIDD